MVPVETVFPGGQGSVRLIYLRDGKFTVRLIADQYSYDGFARFGTPFRYSEEWPAYVGLPNGGMDSLHMAMAEYIIELENRLLQELGEDEFQKAFVAGKENVR